jgi:hypothetical protein
MISENAKTHSGQPVTTLSGSTDALPLEGTVNVAATGVDALTLATPTAGLISNGGDDGRILRVIDTGGHAHTVTTASNKINGNKHIATFGGTAYSFLELVALNGVWVELASSGITLS